MTKTQSLLLLFPVFKSLLSGALQLTASNSDLRRVLNKLNHLQGAHAQTRLQQQRIATREPQAIIQYLRSVARLSFREVAAQSYLLTTVEDSLE